MFHKKKIIFKNTYITSISSNGSTSNILRKKKSYFFHYSGNFYNDSNYYIYEDFKIDIKKIPFFIMDFFFNYLRYVYKNIFLNIVSYNLFNDFIDFFTKKTLINDGLSFLIEDDITNNFFITNHLTTYDNVLNKDVFFY